MGRYEKHHGHEISIPGMPDKITSSIRDKETGQVGKAINYEGGTESFEDLDKRAWERMKEDKVKK